VSLAFVWHFPVSAIVLVCIAALAYSCIGIYVFLPIR
jgi:hypothetical protein